MTEPVNLNKFRKARDKAKIKTTAAENREKFGRTKAERDPETALSQKAARDTNAHKRDD